MNHRHFGPTQPSGRLAWAPTCSVRFHRLASAAGSQVGSHDPALMITGQTTIVVFLLRPPPRLTTMQSLVMLLDGPQLLAMISEVHDIER